jgi:LPS export ABC transporter protein LptC
MRNTAVMIVLALVAAATGLVRWQRATPSPAPAVEESTSPLGYYVRGARLLGTDEQGRVVYRVSAARLEELPGEDRLRFESVRVDYQPNDASAWEISAATASGPRDRSWLELAGNVELRSAPEDDATPVFFATAKLRFSPDTSIAESDEPVEFRVGDWQLKAKGLRTNLKDETLTLESEVHGTFAPR